jgi:hypothetical protein
MFNKTTLVLSTHTTPPQHYATIFDVCLEVLDRHGSLNLDIYTAPSIPRVEGVAAPDYTPFCWYSAGGQKRFIELYRHAELKS